MIGLSAQRCPGKGTRLFQEETLSCQSLLLRCLLFISFHELCSFFFSYQDAVLKNGTKTFLMNPESQRFLFFHNIIN